MRQVLYLRYYHSIPLKNYTLNKMECSEDKDEKKIVETKVGGLKLPIGVKVTSATTIPQK